jgi:hypothetical protein
VDLGAQSSRMQPCSERTWPVVFFPNLVDGVRMVEKPLSNRLAPGSLKTLYLIHQLLQ